MTTHTPKKHRKHPHHHKHHAYRAELAHSGAPQTKLQRAKESNIFVDIGEGVNNVGNGISAAITNGIEGAARGIAGAGGAAYKAMQNGLGGGDHDATPRVAEQRPSAAAQVPPDALVVPNPSAETAGFRPIGAQPKPLPTLAEKQQVVKKGKRTRTPIASQQYNG